MSDLGKPTQKYDVISELPLLVLSLCWELYLLDMGSLIFCNMNSNSNNILRFSLPVTKVEFWYIFLNAEVTKPLSSTFEF